MEERALVGGDSERFEGAKYTGGRSPAHLVGTDRARKPPMTLLESQDAECPGCHIEERAAGLPLRTKKQIEKVAA